MSVDRIQIIFDLRILPTNLTQYNLLCTLSKALDDLQIVHEAL